MTFYVVVHTSDSYKKTAINIVLHNLILVFLRDFLNVLFIVPLTTRNFIILLHIPMLLNISNFFLKRHLQSFAGLWPTLMGFSIYI
jgi:hypothetical protein